MAPVAAKWTALLALLCVLVCFVNPAGTFALGQDEALKRYR